MSAANFLYARWQTYEAGDGNCQGIRICPPKRSWKEPVEHRGTN